MGAILPLCYFGFGLGLLAYLNALLTMGTMMGAISADFGHGAMLTTICLLLFRQAHLEKKASDLN